MTSSSSINKAAHHRRLFYHRFARAMGLAVTLLGGSLGIGIVGYHLVAHLNWVDALENASMILTGMGPVDQMPSTGAKVFASCYALFSGVIFITATGILLAPIFHRVLHKFHIEQKEDE